MPAFNFPDAPALDQLLAGPKCRFIWRGDRWQRTTQVIPILTRINPTTADVTDAPLMLGLTSDVGGWTPESDALFGTDLLTGVPYSQWNFTTTLDPSAYAPGVYQVAGKTGPNVTNSLPFTITGPDVPNGTDVVPSTTNSFGVKTFTMQGSKLLSTASIISDHPTAPVISFALVDDASLTFQIDSFAFNVGTWSFTPKNASGDGTSSGAVITITP